jgi:hypothetical protein
MTTPQPKPHTLTKSGLESWKEYWDRKKGTVAVVAIATTFGALALNKHNLKVCRQFLEERGQLEEFEDWLTPFIVKGEVKD